MEISVVVKNLSPEYGRAWDQLELIVPGSSGAVTLSAARIGTRSTRPTELVGVVD